MCRLGDVDSESVPPGSEQYRSSLPKVTRRGGSMLTSGRSSVSAGMSGSLPASSTFTSGWCEYSARISSDGTGSRSSGSTAVAFDGSGSRSSGRPRVRCPIGWLVPHVRQHQVPSPRSVRFEAKCTGGRTAGATLPPVRTSPRVCAGTHRQVLLPVKPYSRPRV